MKKITREEIIPVLQFFGYDYNDLRTRAVASDVYNYLVDKINKKKIKKQNKISYTDGAGLVSRFNKDETYNIDNDLQILRNEVAQLKVSIALLKNEGDVEKRLQVINTSLENAEPKPAEHGYGGVVLSYNK